MTETRRTSYPAGSPDLVSTAGFDASCSAIKKCNKPNWTMDPAGNQTDYTYGTAHGNVTSVTLPAPVAGGTRPVTNYTYTQYQAYYKNSSGAFVAGSNVYYLTRVAQCRQTSGCTATSADQLRTDIGYGPISVGNNRLPVTTTARNGSGTLIATTTTEYDAVGNIVAVDGPLTGTVDRVATRYDALRRVIGIVGPDPGDAGRPNIGIRTVFSNLGLPATVETGNLSGQADSAWASFVPSQSMVREFDADQRVTKTSLVAGGSTYSVQQVSFDSLGRADCSVTRMNPAYFGSLPQSACTGTSSDPSFGPDRIVKYSYDAADRVTSMISGFGQADAITARAMTYLPGGRLQTLTDGRGNKTTYSYDAYGRTYQIHYPDPASVGVSSSTDYEEFGFDVSSRIVSKRRRSGDVIWTPRDALGRVTMKDLPGGTAEDVYFSYDNQGRVLSALYGNVAGQGIAQTYDGLGRTDTRTVFGRQLGYQYDLAGRRTQLTYPGPGTFYATYAYTNLDELKSITDNTGALLATYSYDGMGARAGLSRGMNGASTTYVPDSIKRLQQLTQDLSGAAFDLTASLAYNPAGQMFSRMSSNDAAYTWTPGTPNSTVTAQFDGQNQLTNFAGSTVTDDANGDVRTGITNLSYTFDALGQLRQATGGSYGGGGRGSSAIEFLLRRFNAAAKESCPNAAGFAVSYP